MAKPPLLAQGSRSPSEAIAPRKIAGLVASAIAFVDESLRRSSHTDVARHPVRAHGRAFTRGVRNLALTSEPTPPSFQRDSPDRRRGDVFVPCACDVRRVPRESLTKQR